MTVPLPIVTATDSNDYPPLSALNDLLFCPRRCALHRLEGVWRDNLHTTAGTLDHRRVHAPRDDDEAPFRTARGLWLVSHRLRLVGVADLVEFRPDAASGTEVPYPVEYKRGKRRRWDNDEAQLCAQALCLEEMLGCTIPAGAVFHTRSKRRREVLFDEALRRQTAETAARLHALLASGATPPPIIHPKCKQCSVHDLCLPDLVAASSRYRQAVGKLFTAPTNS